MSTDHGSSTLLGLSISDVLGKADSGYLCNGSNDDDYFPLFQLSPMNSNTLQVALNKSDHFHFNTTNAPNDTISI